MLANKELENITTMIVDITTKSTRILGFIFSIVSNLKFIAQRTKDINKTLIKFITKCIISEGVDIGVRVYSNVSEPTIALRI